VRPLWILAVAWLASGCVRARFLEGSEIPWAAVERIHTGQTTRTEVLNWLGAPQNFANPTALAAFLESQGIESESYSRYPFADVFVYQFTRGRLKGLIALLYNRFEMHVDSDLVVVLFDEADRVRHLGIRRAPPLD
jgi:hypothetical protein